MISYDQIPSSIRSAVDMLSNAITERSGSIFYSGKEAFLNPSPLYILGLNPGGLPSQHATATVGAYVERFKNRSQSWSEYADESWEGAPAGCWGLQPRILHMLAQLGLDPQTVPASNVVFVQSRNENELGQEKAQLLKTCWPVHQAIIDSLNIRTILCFGATAGAWTREQLGASEQIDTLTENNNRGWTSKTHRDAQGRQVVTVTHPSRADWTNPLADPTPLVRRAIDRGVEIHGG